MRGELGNFFAEGGAVVGGGAALGATLGYIAGSVLHDFQPAIDPGEVARSDGLFGGVAGLAALLFAVVGSRYDHAWP